MKNIICAIIVICLISGSDILFAQDKTQNIWYFGQYAGIDFNQNPPVPLIDGQMNQNEGGASIADGSGNLLFYTEGVNVWDKAHQIMPNGSGLNGNGTSSQSAIIVPFPNDPDKYYIFTVFTSQGLHYTVVDMTLPGNGTVANPNGDIDTTAKNVQLLPDTQVAEKQTIVQHPNGVDYWVIIHGADISNFHAFLIDGTGVKPPVTTTIGNFPVRPGCLRANGKGDKLALVDYANPGLAKMLDFDATTGIVSNPQIISDTLTGPYGVAFSPNDELLYISVKDEILQFEVNPAGGNISATQKNIASGLTSSLNLTTLQLAPDCKIYCAQWDETALHVIHDPDNQTNPGFVANSFNLGGKKSGHGLPNFVINVSVSIKGKDTICIGDSAVLIALGGTDHQWSGGSTATTGTIIVWLTTTTTYYVTANACGKQASDSLTIYVKDCEIEHEIFIPNTFTPNGDLENDVLFVRGKGIKNIKFFIYNRWGEKVFETNNINNGWDGAYKGKKLNTAVFAWYAEVEFEDGDRIYRKGNVTLIR